MKIETHMIVGSDGHEYDLLIEDTDNGTEFTLMHSNNHCWSEGIRDTIAMKAIDDGNGLRIKGLKGKFYLDYAQVMYLAIITKMNVILGPNYKDYYIHKIDKPGLIL